MSILTNQAGVPYYNVKSSGQRREPRDLQVVEVRRLEGEDLDHWYKVTKASARLNKSVKCRARAALKVKSPIVYNVYVDGVEAHETIGPILAYSVVCTAYGVATKVIPYRGGITLENKRDVLHYAGEYIRKDLSK